MPELSAICVYCSASDHVDEVYKDAARAAGSALARHGLRLVYGGGRLGLMGISADAALAEGGEVIGVIPECLEDREIAHHGLSQLIVTQTLQQRQTQMAELSDLFLVLPGGLGTMAEFLEVLTWKQLELHDKPVVIWNVNGYWDYFLKMAQHTEEQSFLHGDLAHLFDVHDDMEAIVKKYFPACK